MKEREADTGVTDLGNIVRTSILVLPAPSTMFGAVPPHGGTACVKVASNTSTSEVVVSLAITTTRIPRGRLTVHVGLDTGGTPGDLVSGPSSKDLTAV